VTEEEQRRFIAAMEEWISRDELAMVRKELGSPEQIVDRAKATKLLLERHEQWKAVMTFLRQMFAALAAFLALLAVAKGLLSGWWP
jgi:hypothetical protein